MTLAALALFAALGFADSKTLAVQIQRALRLYEYTRANARKPALAATPEQAYDRYFANEPEPFRVVEVTRADIAALVKIPDDPAERAKLPRMGYESISFRK